MQRATNHRRIEMSLLTSDNITRYKEGHNNIKVDISGQYKNYTYICTHKNIYT